MSAVAINYMDWNHCVYKGKKFLFLFQRTRTNALGDCEVFGKKMERYGRFYSITSFKKMYSQRGEDLKLQEEDTT